MVHAGWAWSGEWMERIGSRWSDALVVSWGSDSLSYDVAAGYWFQYTESLGPNWETLE